MRHQYLGTGEENLGLQQCCENICFAKQWPVLLRKPCWGAKLGASWYGTDGCGLRSGQPHRLVTSACAGKETTSGLECQPPPKVLPNRGQSISHQCRAPPPIELFPLRNASAFLEDYSLETSRKDGATVQERQRCQLSLRKPISTNGSMSLFDL